MGEIFKPWRRTIGCVTLFMGSVLAAGWARSFVVADTITVVIDEQSFDTFVSCPIGIACSRSRYRKLTLPASMSKITWASSTDLSHWNRPEIPRFMFGFREIGDGDPKSVTVVIRYYTTVIPLILLSAYLLLSKSRSSTLLKTANPKSEKSV